MISMRQLARILSWTFAAALVVWSATAIFLAENASRLPPQNRTPQLAASANASITTPDGITLRAWTQEPASWNGKAVILLHGVADSHSGTTGVAAMLARNGYRTLSPDNRGHGASDGERFSYGVHERNDVTRWLDWMETTWKPTAIFGYGASMGASILLQTMPNEPRLRAVVADCPFATFRAVAYHRVLRAAGPLFAPAVEPALLYSRLRFDINLTAASPEDAMKNSSTPVFLIHGDADRNIPLNHSERLAAAREGRNCELWKVPGAAHVACYRTAPADYERKVLAWFENSQPDKQKTEAPSAKEGAKISGSSERPQ